MKKTLDNTLKNTIAYLPKGRYAIAVSGGSDSLALLYLCAQFSDSEFFVLHFNHKLRDEADDEELFVKQHSQKLGLTFISKNWTDNKNIEGNMYQNARNARYTFFKDIVAEHSLDGVLVAHSKTDIAETLLMRLGKGASLKGSALLSEESYNDDLKIIRPLLDFSRQDLKDYLANQNITWVSDPSNKDESKMRPRLRNILPKLESLGISLDGIRHSVKYFNMANNALDYYTNKELEDFEYSKLGFYKISTSNFFEKPDEIKLRLVNKFIDLFNSNYLHKPRVKNILELLDRLKHNKTSKEQIDILTLEIVDEFLFIYTNDSAYKQIDINFDTNCFNIIKLQDITKKTRYNIIKANKLSNLPINLRNRVTVLVPKNKALNECKTNDFTCLNI